MASVYINRPAKNWVWTGNSTGSTDDTHKHHESSTKSDTATTTTTTTTTSSPPLPPLQTFHRLLPDYAETPLHDLPALATRLGLGRVLLKDESRRFGLPSFKILGASWAVYRAVAARVGVPTTITTISDYDASAQGEGAGAGKGARAGARDLLTSLGAHARAQGIHLVTCTEGNWGRAVARMATHLGIPARVYVPGSMPQATRDAIAGESCPGAEVQVIVVEDGDYDDSVAAARRFAEAHAAAGAVLVMDIAWAGYEEIPQWVVEGYTTMLSEVDDQHAALVASASPAASLANNASNANNANNAAVPPGKQKLDKITHVVVPVGCGSIAQAVTQHFKSATRNTASSTVTDASNASDTSPVMVIAVEPTTAACLRASLEARAMTTVATQDTIMAGLNCGTLSATAWPVLRDGVDASVVVSDWQAHEAVLALGELGELGKLAKLAKLGEEQEEAAGELSASLSAGPCGAATLAALERVCLSGSTSSTTSTSERAQLGLDETAVVVLCCTEGARAYNVSCEGNA